MAKRTFTLSEQESKAFQRAEEATQNVRELKRLQAVRLYGTGQPVETIQTVVGCSWRALMGLVSSLSGTRVGGSEVALARRECAEIDPPAAR
jgi:hypothetical protein